MPVGVRIVRSRCGDEPLDVLAEALVEDWHAMNRRGQLDRWLAPNAGTGVKRDPARQYAVRDVLFEYYVQVSLSLCLNLNLLAPLRFRGS